MKDYRSIYFKIIINKNSKIKKEAIIKEIKNDLKEKICHIGTYQQTKLATALSFPNHSFDERYKENFKMLSNSSQKPSFNGSQSENLSAQECSLPESLITQIIVKCLFLWIIFLSMLNFAPAILSKRLSELNIHEYYYGLIFAIPCVFPVFSIFLTNLMMDKLHGNMVLLTGSVLMAVGFFIVAIKSVIFFLIGISVLGFAAPFTILPLFPMMRNSLSKNNRNSHEAINALSGLYNAALGIGAVLGPLIGANLYFYFGFFTTAYWLANVWVVVSLVLFCIGGWWKIKEVNWESSDYSSLEHSGCLNRSFLEPNILHLPKRKHYQDFGMPRFNSQ